MEDTKHLKHTQRRSRWHSHRLIDEVTLNNKHIYKKGRNNIKLTLTKTFKNIYFTQNNPSDGHSLKHSLHIESVTYKTITTFIHEQSKHKSEFATKKGLWPFLPPMGQITEEEQRQTKQVHAQYACHAKIYVSWSSSIRFQCSGWVVISNKPALLLSLIPVSPCKHGGRWAVKVSLMHMQTGRRTGKEGMGKEGNNRVGEREKKGSKRRRGI